jgi:hypothetical protein
MALRKASIAQLHAEIKRREKAGAKLQKQRDVLAARVSALDAKLAKLGLSGAATASAPSGAKGTTQAKGKRRAAGPRKRPKNELTLADALAGCADVGAIVSPLEAAKLVKDNGYKSSSATFGAQVANALAKHPKFKKQGRAQYKRIK